MKIIDASAADKIKKNMPTNPMTGGASKTLDKPLGIAMKPFFEYFKDVYDPIYSLIDASLTTKSNGPEKTQKIVIPLLTTLLYICNNLNPSETTTSGANTYGIYKITNHILDKYYIGCSVKIARRIREHFTKTKNTNQIPELFDDMELYGRDNFSWEIIDSIYIDNLTTDEALVLLETIETEYINQYPKDKLYNSYKVHVSRNA